MDATTNPVVVIAVNATVVALQQSLGTDEVENFEVNVL
jgi:hypothetical protein